MTSFEPRFKDLVSLFQESATRHAARPIFGTKVGGSWNWITYAEFARMVDQCRGGLAARGIGPGDRVAVISNNRVEWAAGAYATYGLGGSYVPMYEAQQEKEWKYILNDSGSRAVFCATEAIASKVAAMKDEIPTLEQIVCFDAPEASPQSFGALQKQGAAAPAKSVSPDSSAVAGFIYTSGTTGNPKGVLLTHRNLASNVSAALAVFPVLAEDRSLSFLPWAHSFGQVAELHTLIGAGGSLGICEGIPKIIENLAEVQPTVLMAVPNIFNKIYDGVQKQMAGKPVIVQTIFHAAMKAQTRLKQGESVTLGDKVALAIAKKIIFSKIVAKFGGRLRYAMSGGAALSREVAEFVDNLGIMVFEGYGLTETSPVATVNTPAARRIGSVGKAIPGVRVELDHEASGSADEGEIIVHGHNVMKGYYNLPEESAKVFTPEGGFRTGDLGRIDKDGFLFITGRIKELYKLENGKYVAPVALESKLQLSPYILQAMVYGANRPFNVAVLVPKMDALKEWAAAQGINTSDLNRLVQEERVRQLIRAEVTAQGREFKGFEAVKEFIVTAEEFTVANDLLTPKLSMKRRNVLKRYEAEIEALYAGGKGGKAA
jgi:long-chain acyl-CoA synthetase